MVGAGILVLALVLQRGRASKLLVVCAVLAALVATELPDVGTRLSDQADAEANLTERIDSILAAGEIVLSHPFGQSIEEFQHDLQRATLVVVSPHNGFLFLATILGVPALIIFLFAFVAHLSDLKSNIFMALLTLQVCASFLFEQISGNRSYVFVLGIILASAYMRTPLGAPLRQQPEPSLPLDAKEAVR
jgi:O-antigen ligase